MAIWKNKKDADELLKGRSFGSARTRDPEADSADESDAESEPQLEPEKPDMAKHAAPTATEAPAQRRERKEGEEMANIGKSISIKGDVLGDEDTVVEGRVEGRVSLKNHHLTIGPNGDVQGEVSAKQITIVGKVAGNVIASERVEVRDSGRVEGDVLSPRLLVTEGAIINGAITMKEVSAGMKPQSNPSQGSSRGDSSHGNPQQH